MKCDFCGKNEVAFLCRCRWMGQAAEYRLCADCLRSCLQQTDAGDLSQNTGTFHSSRRRPPDRRTGERADCFTRMPALGSARVRTEAAAERVLQQPATRAYFTRLRRRNALQEALQTAVQREWYEEAARLRDRLQILESGFPERDGA